MAEVTAPLIARVLRENQELLKDPENFAKITRMILEKAGYITRERSDQYCHDVMERVYIRQLAEAQEIITRQIAEENALKKSVAIETRTPNQTPTSGLLLADDWSQELEKFFTNGFQY